MTIRDIDFGELYREHMRNMVRGKKSAADWDTAAAHRLLNAMTSDYVTQFIQRMDVSDCESLLDIGSGPGTLSFPLAGKIKTIYALDYSHDMLAVMAEHAKATGITNVHGIYRAWEDDWHDIPVCDIAIASRSSLVNDLEDALAKITSKARKQVYLTTIVDQFIEQPILNAIGRTTPPFPDYIYVVNLLYKMGRHPKIDYINGVNRLADVADFDTLAEKVSWSIGTLNEAEMMRLRQHFDAAMQAGTLGKTPMRWAFISWQP